MPFHIRIFTVDAILSILPEPDCVRAGVRLGTSNSASFSLSLSLRLSRNPKIEEFHANVKRDWLAGWLAHFVEEEHLVLPLKTCNFEHVMLLAFQSSKYHYYLKLGYQRQHKSNIYKH